MSKMEDTEFDFNDAVKDIMAGKNISGKDGVSAPLVKQLVEAALQAEVESHIAQDVYTGNKNRKNGTSSKTIKTSDGEFILDTPRDRAGSFEPQLVKKNQTHLTDDIEQKVLSMYALGLSYADISKHIEDMCQWNFVGFYKNKVFLGLRTSINWLFCNIIFSTKKN